MTIISLKRLMVEITGYYKTLTEDIISGISYSLHPAMAGVLVKIRVGFLKPQTVEQIGIL
jgi:hypothetical protein